MTDTDPREILARVDRMYRRRNRAAAVAALLEKIADDPYINIENAGGNVSRMRLTKDDADIVQVMRDAVDQHAFALDQQAAQLEARVVVR